MANEINGHIALIFIFLGAILISGVWLVFLKWYRNKVINRVRKELETRLPFTIEEIEAERELAKATHLHELKVMELRIAELVKREAEANLKTRTALNRVSKLNDRVERLRLELAVSRQKKTIVKEQVVK